MATVAPRVVICHRPTEWDVLLQEHATPGQVRFFLESRDRKPGLVIDRDRLQSLAMTAVEAAIPPTWRRTRVSRRDLPSFLFEPTDIVVAVGQDGLVPNLAKYLDGQLVLGVNPESERYEGVLVRYPVAAVADLMSDIAKDKAGVEIRTMAEARLDDGQSLVALNEIYVGHRSHQSSRYRIGHRQVWENQSSSGLIVATGTGATGWARSIAAERRSRIRLPSPTDPSLAFFVREAWPSTSTGTEITEGSLGSGDSLRLISEIENGGVVFGDGIEPDHLDLRWGQEVTIGIAAQTLRLVT
ncbi:MAG: hypothetical protein GY722_25740 [bacterium]|nr:hypothetical protein [bacterium]